MLATKRYEYLPIDKIGVHDELTNHRPLNTAKVAHLEEDIRKNGLLEPLVVWERSPGEYYLVGGFHRMAAIAAVRAKNSGFFDRVDVRVVGGDPDEIKALNLKLNSDRVDTRVTDFFQTVLYLNNAGWPRERIAEFFDKSVSWIEDIIRFAPMVTPAMHAKIAEGVLSWNRAREIIQKALKAPVGKEKAVIDGELSQPHVRAARPLTFKSAIGRLSKAIETKQRKTFTVDISDLYALILTLQGKNYGKEHLERVKKSFSMLMD